MKALKLILGLFLLIGLVSCSDDDDGGSNGANDRIVGEWRIDKVIMNGVEIELGECGGQSGIVFLANGNAIATDFYEDFDTGDCISDVYNEKWQYSGNNVYKFTDEDGEVYDVTITFSNNNNTFTITEEDDVDSYSIRYVRV